MNLTPFILSALFIFIYLFGRRIYNYGISYISYTDDYKFFNTLYHEGIFKCASFVSEDHLNITFNIHYEEQPILTVQIIKDLGWISVTDGKRMWLATDRGGWEQFTNLRLSILDQLYGNLPRGS